MWLGHNFASFCCVSDSPISGESQAQKALFPPENLVLENENHMSEAPTIGEN